MSKLILIIAILAGALFLVKRSAANRQKAALGAQQGLEFLAANRNKDGVQETDSGLQYTVLVEGDGGAHPGAGDKVKVHYHGTLIDGTVFDSSVERGEPIAFGLNQVIKGWTEGLQLMVVGQKNRLFIPSELAYGDRATGRIPPGSVLVFDVELLGINE